MSDLIQALANENPGSFAPPPDQANPMAIQEGGAHVFEKGGHAPADGGAPAPAQDASAALVAALQQVIKPAKETVELGETVPMLDGNGSPVQAQPQAEQPVATQSSAQPESVAQQAQPTPDMLALANQYAQAQARLQQAEAIAQEQVAWRQQNEPLLNAVRQKWPEIQGLQAQNAELQAKVQYEADKAKYIQDSFTAGQAPDIAAFDAQHRLNQTLAKAANIEQTVEQTMARMLDQRDATYQQQQAQAQQQQYVAQVQQHFVQSWSEIERTMPAFKGQEVIREAVWGKWSQNPQVPVAQVAAQFAKVLQAQTVAQQAPQMTRAEVAASAPRTVVGGSGAAARPVPARPAGWDQWGLQERIAYNRSRQ